MKTRKKAVSPGPAPMWLLNQKNAPPVVALGAMVVVILLTLVFNSIIKKDDQDAGPSNSTTTVSGLEIRTDDGVTLSAKLDLPVGSGPWPVVILLHEFGQDKNQWSPMRESFITAGLAVLAVDLRGFGGSSLAAIPASQSAWFATMPNDLAAAVKYLQTQRTIDHEKIFVVGVGLGANVAYIGSGTVDGVAKSVVISPTQNAALDGSALDNFFPKNIYALGNPSDESIIGLLMSRVTGETITRIATDENARGLELLQTEGQPEGLLTWLKQ